MRLLQYYLISRLSLMSAYALFSILALYSFIGFVTEVNNGNIGIGHYTVWTAIQFVAMQMPAYAYQLMPLATLIGGLLALNQLSSNSEWAVIKTSGLSTVQIVGIILKFSAIFAVLTILLGELLVPELSRRGDILKATAKSGSLNSTAHGVWLKQNNSMVNIDTMLPDKTLLGIKIWRYNKDFQLTEAMSAEKAQVHDNKWTLYNVQRSQLSDKQVNIQHEAQMDWESHVNQTLLTVLLVQPEQMSFVSLSRYIHYLKQNQQQTTVYDVAWWNKLVYPIATMVMSLLALAFTPNSGRHSNMGLKLFGGICLGLLFFFTGRLFGFTAQLYGLPAFLAAILPTGAFAVWAVYLIRKQEAR